MIIHVTIRVYDCVYTSIYIRECVCVWMCICWKCAYMYVHECMCNYVHAYVYISVCMYASVWEDVYMYMYIYIYVQITF